MDKKPALAILIGEALKKKHSPKEESTEPSGSDMDDAMLTIAEEMLAAIKEDDASKLKDLLMEAVDCMHSPESE